MDQCNNLVMREIPAAKFKEQCLALLEQVDPDGIVTTKRGKPRGETDPDRDRFREPDRITAGKAQDQSEHPLDRRPLGC